MPKTKGMTNLIWLWACLICSLFSACAKFADSDTISGFVYDQSGPISGAVVRIQTTDIKTITDLRGNFSLNGADPGKLVTLTAWKTGYYISGLPEVKPGMQDVKIHLEQHTKSDNPTYSWLPSLYHPGQGENQGCAECHSNKNIGIDLTLPVDEWLLDKHSQSAKNPLFISMYQGSDISGNQSPPTQYEYSRDYGTFPLTPDPEKPYYGPGYKLDFPDTNGNCAACHTPAASVNNPYEVDPTAVTGVSAEGILCDFCHKIWDVKLNQAGMPNDNMPGVLSFEFMRPSDDHQLFIGPLDDVAPGEDTYSPLQTQSQFCAPCHYGTFWDTVIYNSYGEWLESPYSDPETGQQCQDCHMPPLGFSYFADPEKGGRDRNPSTIFSHQMPGAGSEDLLQNTVTMEAKAKLLDNKVQVIINITNDQAGHHVPTDSPLRHLILIVDVKDTNGNRVTQLAGPVLPDWVGTGDPERGYYAGLPGKTFAKVLQERWTQISPSSSYWNPTIIVSDNRLAAYETDSSNYTFNLPDGQPITINVSLIFRRAYLELAEQKSWDVQDILMEGIQLQLP